MQRTIPESHEETPEDFTWPQLIYCVCVKFCSLLFPMPSPKLRYANVGFCLGKHLLINVCRLPSKVLRNAKRFIVYVWENRGQRLRTLLKLISAVQWPRRKPAPIAPHGTLPQGQYLSS